MENKDNDIELLAGQVWNAPTGGAKTVRQAQFDALMQIARDMPPLDIELTEEQIDQIAAVNQFFGFYLPAMLYDGRRQPVPLTPEQIEARRIYGGDQWSEEDIAALKSELRRTPFEFKRIHLVPQAEIVRHPIPPGMSGNTHEAPHYSDLLPKKDHS